MPIPYGHQNIDKADITEVAKALKSDWLTQGPKVEEFEDALAAYTGAKYCVAISSGTAALHLLMLSLGVKSGDKVITSPITFSASANCALYVNASPSFVDIDDSTYHMDIEKFKDFLKTPSKRKHVKAVIPVHLMGTVVDVNLVSSICDKYGISIIEDAAHALGAEYKRKDNWIRVGSCKDSDAAIFSFHPIKQITTGEGGAVLTNNKKIYEAAKRLRHHGIVKSKNTWVYDIPEPGFNYRITDFQSALGISQLKKIDKIVSERKRLVKTYTDNLSEIKGIRFPCVGKDMHPSYHLFVIRVSSHKRSKLYHYLKSKGISTQINYLPVHLFSYYRKTFGYKKGDFPVAENYGKECLSLPLYVGLTKDKQFKVIDAIRRFFK